MTEIAIFNVERWILGQNREQRKSNRSSHCSDTTFSQNVFGLKAHSRAASRYARLAKLSIDKFGIPEAFQ